MVKKKMVWSKQKKRGKEDLQKERQGRGEGMKSRRKVDRESKKDKTGKVNEKGWLRRKWFGASLKEGKGRLTERTVRKGRGYIKREEGRRRE